MLNFWGNPIDSLFQTNKCYPLFIEVYCRKFRDSRRLNFAEDHRAAAKKTLEESVSSRDRYLLHDSPDKLITMRASRDGIAPRLLSSRQKHSCSRARHKKRSRKK